jgi:ribonuclease P protein component
MNKARKSDIRSLHRILNRADFVRGNQSKLKWTAHGMAVQVVPHDAFENDFDDIIRAGFTVTKKTEKSAVKRNRIKRRLRAVAADVLPFEAKKAHDYILIGRRGADTRPYDDLVNDLRWCLKKMSMLREADA